MGKKKKKMARATSTLLGGEWGSVSKKVGLLFRETNI